MYPKEKAFLIYPGCTVSAEGTRGRVVKSCRNREETLEAFSGLNSKAEKSGEDILVKEYTLFACGNDEFGDFAFPVKQSRFSAETLAKALDWPLFISGNVQYVLIPSGSGEVRIVRADSVISDNGSVPGVIVELEAKREIPLKVFALSPMQRYEKPTRSCDDSNIKSCAPNEVSLGQAPENFSRAAASQEASQSGVIEKSVMQEMRTANADTPPAQNKEPKENRTVEYAICKYNIRIPISDANRITEGYAIRNASPVIVVKSKDFAEIQKNIIIMRSTAEKAGPDILITEYAIVSTENDEETILEQSSFEMQKVIQASGAEIITAGKHKFAVISTEPAKNKKSTIYHVVSVEENTFGIMLTGRYQFHTQQKDTKEFKAMAQPEPSAPPINIFSLFAL